MRSIKDIQEMTVDGPILSQPVVIYAESILEDGHALETTIRVDPFSIPGTERFSCMQELADIIEKYLLY